jgi:hypothetical protein
VSLDAMAIVAALDDFATAATKLANALRAEVKRAVLAETPSKVTRGPAQRRESKPTPLPKDDAPAGADKMRRSILVALAQCGRALTNAQIGIYSGKAHKGGAFSKAMAGLRADGCVEGSGDANRITITGFGELGEWTPLPEGSALFEFWCSKLGSMETQILRAVRRSNVPMSTAAIGAAIEKSHTGGAFSKAMARLRKMDLVDGGGEAVELSAELRAALEPAIRVHNTTTGASVRLNRHGSKVS